MSKQKYSESHILIVDFRGIGIQTSNSFDTRSREMGLRSLGGQTEMTASGPKTNKQRRHGHMGKEAIIIMIMKSFNRRGSHGHHGSKRREQEQQAHSHGSHAFTHTLYINTVTTT